MNAPKNVSVAANTQLHIPKQVRPIVYLGHFYHDTQQYAHFEEQYHFYQQLPLLVPTADAMSQHYTIADNDTATSGSLSYHSTTTDDQSSPTVKAAAFQTRVGTVPSFAPKNQSLRDMHMGTTTLALKLEPSIPSKVSSNSQRTPFNVSVFSGPHYQPEKYTVKSSADYGNKYFLQEQFSPSTFEAKCLVPSLDYRFQSALKDGSHFASYSDYNAENPENFRHAYGVPHQPSQLMDLYMNPDGASQAYVATAEPSAFNPTRLQQERPPHESEPTPHQQLLDQSYTSSSSSPQTDTASQDERVNQILEAANLLDFNNQFSFTADSNNNDDREKSNNKGQRTTAWPATSQAADSDTDGESSSDSPDVQVKTERSSTKRDQHGNLKHRSSPPAYQSKDPSHQKPPVKGSRRTSGKTIARVPSSNANTSFHDDDDTVVSISSTQSSPRVTYVVPSDSDEHEDAESDATSATDEAAAAEEKRPKVEERPIPSKTLTINKCRDWGKFLQSWRIKKRPPVCSICLEAVISSEAPSVVYCDSPQCDVLIHRSCLNRTELPMLVQKYWLCDKCFFLDTMDQDCPFVVTCALCPNTNGLFCKLSPYLHDIPWVHFTCAKVFQARPNDFSYQAELGEYEARFDLIPIDRFAKTCEFCTDPIYASYGAKVTCSDCDKSFHVTCAQMNQVQVSLKSGNARCLSHFKHDERASQQIQRSKDYSTWINLKEAYLLRQFNKDSRMFAIDIWKALAKDAASFSMGNRKINAHYIRFLHRIKHVHYEVEGTLYSQWINYTLAFFNAVYSARDMESYTVSFSSELFASHKLIWKQYNFFQDTKEASPQPLAGTSEARGARGGSVEYLDSSGYDDHMGTSGGRHAASDGLIEIMDPSSPWLMPPHLKSPHQICSICKKTKLPAEVCANLGITEEYLKNLETTKDKRPPGHTGNLSYWDPRVFIQCSKCLSILHCGCPETPIKKHPEKNKVFVCIFCDRHGEMVAAAQALGSRRSRKINYKE
ncbi:hypothetical protein MBANPS3_009757 [Mucor bainieri]